MTTYYSTELTGIASSPVVKASTAAYGGGTRRYRATITYASQASGSDFVLAKVPPGSNFMYGMITTSASTASATLAIGVSGTTGKYKAAGAVTATDVPQLFGIASGKDDADLTAEETVLLTVAADALPASGTLVIDLVYSQF